MKTFLRKFPSFYSVIQKAYYGWARFCERVCGTSFQEYRWKVRHLLKHEWAQGYINSVSHPHRAYWVEKVMPYAPVGSILEIGCNAGPNLSILARHFPDARLYGIDINKQAISQGKQWLEREYLSNVELSVGKADDLRHFKDKSVDIIFTDAILLYVGPDKIKRVLSEMQRVSRKAMIFLEFHETLPSMSRSYDAHWIYDYEKLCRSYLPSVRCKLSKLPSDVWNDMLWHAYGYFVEISFP